MVEDDAGREKREKRRNIIGRVIELPIGLLRHYSPIHLVASASL
jgi:hypothetical protein